MIFMIFQLRSLDELNYNFKHDHYEHHYELYMAGGLTVCTSS